MVSFIPGKLAETVGFFPALPVGAVFGVTRAAFFRGYRGKGFRGYPLLFFSRLPGVLKTSLRETTVDSDDVHSDVKKAVSAVWPP